MPIDADMADLPTHGQDRAKPRWDTPAALRLALGVAVIFILGMALEWPFAFVAAILAALFLQAPAAPALRSGARLVGLSFGLLLFGYGLFSALLPFPAIFMIAQLLLLIWAFSLSVTGNSPLIVVIALIESVMMPFLVLQSLDVALIFAIWLPMNMGVALLATWTAFALFPAPERTRGAAAANADAVPSFDPMRRLLRMTLVTAPFVFAFFLLQGGAVLTLLFVAILSFKLASSTSDGPKVAGIMLLANAVGGIAAVVAYELVVIETHFLFMAVIVLLLCCLLSVWVYSEAASAALAGTALSTALILLGGAMAPFGDAVEFKMLDRLVQIAAALAWVLTSFVVVDRLLPERPPKPKLPDWRPARGKVGEDVSG
jgi:hypothetical protein